MIDSLQNTNTSMISQMQMRPPHPPKAPPLTDEQKTQLEQILSKYNPENITKADAQQMFTAFEDAGIGGPELKKAIEKAGFDANQVWELAHGDKPRPQEMNQGGSINTTALKSLQDILNQYDFSSISKDSETDLMSKLNGAGLLMQGSVIDLRM